MRVRRTKDNARVERSVRDDRHGGEPLRNIDARPRVLVWCTEE